MKDDNNVIGNFNIYRQTQKRTTFVSVIDSWFPQFTLIIWQIQNIVQYIGMQLSIPFRHTYLYDLRHVGLHPLRFQCLCFQRWGRNINASSVDWTSLESPHGDSHLLAILCAWLRRMHRLESMHAAIDLRCRILRGNAKNVELIITSMSIDRAKNVTIVCTVEDFRIGMNICGAQMIPQVYCVAFSFYYDRHFKVTRCLQQ